MEKQEASLLVLDFLTHLIHPMPTVNMKLLHQKTILSLYVDTSSCNYFKIFGYVYDMKVVSISLKYF